jgi:hypothetical protein
MNTRKLSLRLAALALVATAASGAVYGCSSDDSNSSNPGPSSHDGGGNDGTVSSNDSGGSDAGNVSDAPVIDTGSCVSDASTCNSCYTPTQAQQDPLNGCAPETANCIPFTGTVPTHPML